MASGPGDRGDTARGGADAGRGRRAARLRRLRRGGGRPAHRRRVVGDRWRALGAHARRPALGPHRGGPPLLHRPRIAAPAVPGRDRRRLTGRRLAVTLPCGRTLMTMEGDRHGRSVSHRAGRPAVA
ncbi:hypothetical protein SGPA1_12333 [Streptomyces misionensis JCM 4497]